MKKILLLTAVVVLIGASVFAQVPSKPFSLYVGGGMNLPTSPDNTFKSAYKTGYHGMVGIGLGSMPMMQFVGKAELYSFPSDVSGLGDFSSLMFGADVRFSMGVPAAPARPFVFGGGGLAHVKIGESNAGGFTIPSASDNNFYYNVGAGLEFNASPSMKLFVQTKYVGVHSGGDNLSFIPITVGLKF
jgi:opacity protein-like surface antigen